MLGLRAAVTVMAPAQFLQSRPQRFEVAHGVHHQIQSVHQLARLFADPVGVMMPCPQLRNPQVGSRKQLSIPQPSELCVGPVWQS